MAVLVGAGVEEGRNECELVVLPLVLRAGARLERLEDRLQAQDVLAQPRPRRRWPRGRVASFVVALHLRAEAQDEPAAGEALQVPGDLRRHHWAPREGDGDARAEPELLR